ncbi:E1A-binding protein p400-like isoform X9 [Asterias amurensis]|uniref:E1A-binding protein p400-like isoform X9 n=1 Tax=Asterias amurensis TaxID=7602 RepID=UPI003AB899B7
MQRGSSDDSQSGVYHKLGSPPQQPQPQQQQTTQRSIDLSQGLPSHSSGYVVPQHTLQQYLINPVAGVQGAQVVASSRPIQTSPIRVPAQHAQVSPSAVVLQQQQQQQNHQDVARQQAFMQLASLRTQLIAGTSNQVINLQLSPGFVDPSTGLSMQQMSVNTPPTSIGTTNPYVFHNTPKLFSLGEEPQISQEQIQLQSLLLPSHHQPVGTIHHHGQGSPRSTMPPLSSSGLNFGAARRMSSHSPTRGAPDRKSPTAGGGAYHRSLSSPARTNPIPSSPSRMRKSPLMASETDHPPATNEVAELRTRLLEHKLETLHDLQEGYKERLIELFFLENGHNMMDFIAWKKRPCPTLHNYMMNQKLEGREEEITINDEVKVITNSGSTRPLSTPVAISTQLPPAVSALSSQIKAKELRKSFPGALPTASPDMDRKRTYSQAGLDSSITPERKPLGFPSSHEPNVTLSHKTITPIPALPGSQPSPLYKQHKQLAAGQHQHHGTSNRSQIAAAVASSSTMRTSLGVPHVRREPKSPPTAKHSLHQLKAPTNKPLTVNTTASTEVTSTAPVGGSLSPRRHSSGSATGTPPIKLPKSPISPNAHQRLATRQHSLSAVYDYTIGSQEMIVERAKQEAQVMQRIAELRKEGLWSARRLPKVQEPPRHKTHWEYLLEEAQWLATDFIQERRWKKAAARKLVRAVARFHQEKHTKEVKAEREETQKLRRIAGNIAKEIKTFWSNIEKVVQYKQQSRLDDRRRKAMDMQLDYIVGQTEKYSSWLTEGLNLNAAGSAQGSVASSPRSDPSVATPGDDVDFQPEGDESDDEETIDVEEREAEDDQDAHKKELELLQKESEVPLEDLIGSLPPEILEDGKEEKKEESKDGEKTEEKVKKQEEEEPGLSEVTKEVEEESKEKSSSADEEFVPSTDDEDEEMPDDEETLQEQEDTEGTTDHTAEVAELQAEGEMTMEELLKKYSGAYDDDFEMPLSEEEEEEDEDEGEQEDEETEEEEEDLGTDDEESELTDIGMEYLINPDKENEKSAGAVTPAAASQAKPQDPGPNKEITDIAAAAQSLQPTGYTLSTTQVKTPVPFLLRHKLREYQHIGLDWLVTMHDKRLNGILADEMGLGKTIQTIALLAHMACGLGNWGPHLIVVPTSVMLNWELEFKKWCPGFKILTYFGSQKERKLKRQGWTKSNAFHVCITSYKLVIQDHQSFRRKKWKYLVLDEAQNIKNFKSQRWQTLLNFNSQRRLLLTGTPLQNNLMELWSLMHFLMPHVFASHREFREWFSNPLSGMIEGTQEYNEGLIRRLHKVLRPFLLRRLKCEVEKQLPQKYEHVVRCRLSKRQRFLYDDFMSQAKTRETLSSGHFMSVINVLMQLRKVCNHPDLFESRPIQSPFKMEGIRYYTASLITKALEHDPHKNVSLNALRMCIANLEMILPAYAAHRIKQLQTPRPLIEEIDSAPDLPPRPQPMKFKPGKLFPPPASAVSQAQKDSVAIVPTDRVSPVPAEQTKASPVVVSQPMKTAVTTTAGQSTPTVSHVLVRSAAGIQMLRTTSTPTQGRSSPSVSLAVVNSTPSSTGMPSLTLVSHPVPSTTSLQQLPGFTGIVSSAGTSPGQQRFYLQQQTSGAGRGQFVTTQPITVQLQGGSGTQTTKIALPASQIRQMSQSGIVQIVQTPSGHQILRPAVRFTSPSTTQQQQQQNPSRSSPVPIQMTLQATSPQIPGSILNQGSVTTSQTSLAQSQAQTVIQALAQAVTQASSAGQATSTFSSQQLQSVLAQLQRQQLQQQQRKLQQQQQQQQQAVQSQATSTATMSSTTQSIRLTPQQITKPIASVAPMVNVTLSQVGGIKPVLAPTVVQPKPQTPSLQMPTPQKPDTPKERIQEGIAKTTTAVPCSAVTSPPPLVAIRPHYSAPQVNPKAIPSPGVVGGSTPTMQPVLKIRPLSNVSIAKATGGPKVSVTTAGSRPAVKASNLRKKAQKDKDSPFFLESLHQDGIKERKSTLARLANLNHIRCNTKPAYGSDLRSAVSIFNSSHPAGEERPFASCTGLFHCQGIHGLPFPYNTEARISQTSTLRSLVKTPEVIIDDLKEIIKRYVMMVPMATSPPITMHVSHPAPSVLHQQKVLSETMRKELTPRLSCLHPIQSGMVMHFPELRLIQYDCGKLQSLDFLLRKLKLGSHRVLIFTQMTRMLDVLESFLNYHGHIYVRLDGTTKVEQRQVLMDRFNMDKRIFCFILSTRSGGLGINLTGADTVVFYDSDWNPTMDAQAQDRCHRIGQTRDVHIYRLISEMTVEENILKKANQKRLLVDVSIEGGNFTTAFFKTNTITDIFNLSNRREAEPVLIEEMDIPTGKEPKVAKAVEPEKADKPEQAAAAEAKAVMTQNQLEQALAKTEDETDVKATSKALAEQDADLAEFDETIPYEGEEGTKSKDDVSKVEIELAQLDNQLTNIEKYAMKYLESTLEPIAMDEMLEAEEQVELAKKEWELERLQALKEAEERKAELEEDEIFFTYTNEESKNKVYISNTNETMPMWAPPTPPQDENDVYVDYSASLMYESSIMMESQLPQVYVKKEHKKAKVDQGVRKIKPHTKTGETPHHTAHIMTPPQSLFNRPSAALLRMRREAKQQKLRAMAGKPVVKPLPIVHRTTATDTKTADRHEWLINEDWALLQAVQALQELPLTLQAVVPGHVINWDLVSDIVNGCCRIYRSPKQCRHRYETVIIPREEGKILYDTNPKKQKKSKGIYRQTKNNRPMKTSQLHTQDGNASHTNFYSDKFELIKTVIGKRQPYLKQVLNNPLLKNPKHSAVLNDFGISYDKPMSPIQAATKRAERIAREKKAAAEQQQRQRIQEAQAKQQQQQVAAAAAAVVQPVATATTAAVMQSGTINRTALGTGAIRVTGANSIVVNTPGVVAAIPGNSFASINKRMSQQQVGTVVTIAGSTPVMATVASSLAQVVRAQAQGVRTTVAHVTLPSSAGIITSQVRTAVTSGTQVVITSAGTGSQARTTPAGTALTAKMAAAHFNLQMIKQQAMKQHQLIQQQQQQQLTQQQVTAQQQAQIKLKQAELKRLHQAQAQAQAAQAQAQAQAQAVQLQSGQKASTSTVAVSQVAAVVSATSTLTQAQLSQTGQQRAQLAGKTVTRPLKSDEVAAFIKRQQLLNQKNPKTTTAAITTLPLTTVAGVKGITVSGLTIGSTSGQKGLTAGQQGSIPMKALTIPNTVSKMNFQQILQMQKVQHQAKQQQLLNVKAQQILTAQKLPVSTVVSQGQLQGTSGTIGGAQIRISSPTVTVAVSGALANQQVVQTASGQQQRVQTLSQQVSGLTPQQLQQVRVQRVTTSQAQGSPTVVQRVGQVQQLATVRQQLQQQVKQSQAAGATLSIQQAGKPVTIIPTVSGTSLLTVAKSMGQTHIMTPAQKQILTQLVSSGGTQNMTQLARVLSQAQAQAQALKNSQANAAAQGQQTVTVQSVPGSQTTRVQPASGTPTVQVVGSGQLAASIQAQVTLQSGSPVQVTLTTQPSKMQTAVVTLSQAQQSPAQRQAVLQTQAQRLVQQQLQAQKQPTGSVQTQQQQQAAAVAAAQQQRLQQQKLQAVQQHLQQQKNLSQQTLQKPTPPQPQITVQTKIPEPQVEATIVQVPQPQAQPQLQSQEQTKVDVESESEGSSQAAKRQQGSSPHPATSPDPQQQQAKQQPAVRASPYAMRLRKPSHTSNQ